MPSRLGAEAAQLRGRDRLDGVVEDDTLDDIADVAAVENIGDIGHRNNDEAAGVGRQCRLDPLLNVSGVKRFCSVPPRKSVSEKSSDPTLQGHPTAAPIGGLHQKSAFAQPFNRTGMGARSPAECDITQNSQIAHVEITLHPATRQ
jgi:hypothetical protein